MTRETNPESGIVTTAYDTGSAGDLYTRTYPKPSATGVYVTATYTWDTLHRMANVSFSDGSLPYIYTYDRTSNWGHTLTNTKGRLVESEQGTGSTAVGAATYSYDPMGRIATTWVQCTGCSAVNAHYLSYTYNYLGEPVNRYVGDGAYYFTNAYNAIGELTGISNSFVDATHPASMFSGGTYNALGELTQGTYGDGIVRTNAYDHMGRLTARRDNPTYYALALGYTGNGSVNYYNDTTAGDWSFTYDAFNRLATSTDASNGNAYSYSYDQFGNRWHQTKTAGTGLTVDLTFDANNHITGSGVGYDGGGNLLKDGSGCNPCWTYDVSGHVVGDSGGASFGYDGLGRRVRKTVGTTIYDFLLDPNGAPWDEYQATVHSRVNGGLFTFSNNTTYFNRTDHEGTPRVTTNYTGAIVRTENNLPFADGFTQTPLTPVVDFTGYAGGEWDAENNADHFGAREYAKTQGRWIQPDPAGLAAVDPSNPQTWNRYAYVVNNPVSATDPSGLCFLCTGGHSAYDGWDPFDILQLAFTPTAIAVFNPDLGPLLGDPLGRAAALESGQAILVYGNISLLSLLGGPPSLQTSVAPAAANNWKKGCRGARITKGIQGTANVGLGSLKFLGSAGLGLLGVAGAPETGGGSLLLDGVAAYGMVSSGGQVVSGTSQLYAAFTGNFQSPATAQQIGDIWSGPIAGGSTLLATGNGVAAAAAANVESSLTAGAGLVNATTFAEKAASRIDAALSILGVGDPQCK
jgi:RHS repeat-associated protein